MLVLKESQKNEYKTKPLENQINKYFTFPSEMQPVEPEEKYVLSTQKNVLE